MSNNSDQNQEIFREEILHQIFGEIGAIIEDFSCAVESTVLMHGRLYVTRNFVCFYSNLFGLEKKMRIPYSHIKTITKENTAMVFPNAISICTNKKDYTFRSFWDRDQCYKLLNQQLERYRNESLGGDKSSTSSTSTDSTSSSTAPTTSTSAPTPAPVPSSVSISTSTSTNVSINSEDIVDTEINEENTSPKDTSYKAPQEYLNMFTEEINKCKLKNPVTNFTLPISVYDFAKLFILEKAEHNYAKYHEMTKDTNVVPTTWKKTPNDFEFEREIKFFKPVNLPGLASTRGVKLQKLRLYFKKPSLVSSSLIDNADPTLDDGSEVNPSEISIENDIGFVLYSCTRLEDVPSAHCFSVDDVVVVKNISTSNIPKIEVDISFQVTFIRSTMMKYIIESSTNAEMIKWLDVFSKNNFKKNVEIFLKNSPTSSPVNSPKVETSPKPG